MRKKVFIGGSLIFVVGIILISMPTIFPIIINEPHYPESAILMNQDFMFQTSPNATYSTHLNAGEKISLQVLAFSEDSDFSIDLSVNAGSTTYLSYSGVTQVFENWTVPLSQDYNFSCSRNSATNSFGFGTIYVFKTDEVTYTPTVYYDSTSYMLIIVGAIFSSVGIVTMVLSLVKKPKKSQVPNNLNG